MDRNWNLAGTGIDQIWPEPEFDRNFANRHILLKKITRLIILGCTGYILTFKAAIFVTTIAAL